MEFIKFILSRDCSLLVHGYARIDPEIVIGILHRDVDDLKKFAAEILDSH